MHDETSQGAAPDEPTPERLVLDAEERRVIGVLIEKGLTTPQQYPMSLSAIVTACNQKSNRDPVTHYEEDQVEEVLERLQARELLSHFYPGEGGRVDRWRQNLGTMFELRRAQLAIVGELLLRGAQAEGELRQRASRMEPIESRDALHELLRGLASSRPRWVVRLTPEGVARGVRYTHACHAEGKLEAIVEAERAGDPARAPSSPSRSPSPPPAPSEVAALNERIEALERRVASLEEALGGAPEAGRSS
ncbi:MAG: DUF480 domain-containing protein [Planctomycetota bacterium JB042]